MTGIQPPHTTMADVVDEVIASARELLARVTFDDCGIMVGQKQRGGNGGLLSDESRRAAVRLRRAAVFQAAR